MPAYENLDSDQGTNDSPETDAGCPAVWRSDASRIPFYVLVQTSVVRWVIWLNPEISYYSMGDGHPRRRHPQGHHLPLHTTPSVDARRMSVQPAGVGAWVLLS